MNDMLIIWSMLAAGGRDRAAVRSPRVTQFGTSWNSLLRPADFSRRYSSIDANKIQFSVYLWYSSFGKQIIRFRSTWANSKGFYVNSTRSSAAAAVFLAPGHPLISVDSARRWRAHGNRRRWQPITDCRHVRGRCRCHHSRPCGGLVFACVSDVCSGE